MKYIVFIAFAIIVAGCAQLNDKHDEFLQRGETVYIGKVDSVNSHPGNQRLLLKYWISDPRAKQIKVLWGVNDSNSKEIAVPTHSPLDELDVMFDTELAEGNYTFHWISYDQYGNKSMIFEKIASVYGAQYQAKLINRRVTETQIADNGDLTVLWGGSSSTEEVGIELNYIDNQGVLHTNRYPQLGSSLLLTDIDVTKGVSYRTLYLPEPAAIDTFYTAFTQMSIVKSTNVALNKPVTCSDINDPSSAAQQPENAVDGNYATSATRWVATTGAPPHWLEIDLLGEYAISSFMTWTGSNGYNYPMSSMELQAWINGQWVTVHSVTGNGDAVYGSDFAPVTTNKVRFLTYSEVRLFEIAVYSNIKY
jgi:hypothetical protein